MQRTPDCHHHVAQASFPLADGLFEPAATLDTAGDRFDAPSASSDLPVPRVLGARQLWSAGLLRRLKDVHAIPRQRLKAQVLQPLTPHGQRIRRGSGAALVVDMARMRLAEAQHAHGPIDQPEVWPRGPLVLAALTRLRCSRVLGARDGPLGPVMTTRGTAVGGTTSAASAGEATTGRRDPATPSCARRVSTWRQGASPNVRSVLRHTSRQTGIHGVALEWRMPQTRPCSRGVGCCWR